MNLPAIPAAVDVGIPAPEPRTTTDRVRTLVYAWLSGMRSPHTRYNYGLDIGVPVPLPGKLDLPDVPHKGALPWLDYCDAVGVEPLGARREHVALWLRQLDSLGLSNSTKARKMSAVSSWYRWLADEGHIAGNPAQRVARPKVDQDSSTTPGVTKDQALAMLAAAGRERGPQAHRNRALLHLLLFTGARISEICGATLADLGVDRGNRVLWVTRKGGKRQSLAIPGIAGEHLDAYLASRVTPEVLPARPGEQGRSPLLFATATGKRLFPGDVWRVLQRIARQGNLPEELARRFGPHAARHAFATLSLDAGASLRDLQDALGHADPRTTRRYDRARHSLDRSPGYVLAAYLSGGGGDE